MIVWIVVCCAAIRIPWASRNRNYNAAPGHSERSEYFGTLMLTGVGRPSAAPAIDRFARSIAHWSLDQGCCGSTASNGCQVWQKCSVVKVLNGCGPCGVSNCI